MEQLTNASAMSNVLVMKLGKASAATKPVRGDLCVETRSKRYDGGRRNISGLLS